MKKLLQRIFKKSVKNSSTKDALLPTVEIATENDWQYFDNRNTLGQKGSEDGIVICDQENTNGARITLEANAGNIPFVITLGIYGWMFHTAFFGEKDLAIEYFIAKKLEIDRILDLISNHQDSKSDEIHLLIENLVYN